MRSGVFLFSLLCADCILGREAVVVALTIQRRLSCNIWDRKALASLGMVQFIPGLTKKACSEVLRRSFW